MVQEELKLKEFENTTVICPNCGEDLGVPISFVVCHTEGCDYWEHYY